MAALNALAAAASGGLAALDDASEAVTPGQALSPGAGPPQFALDQGPGQAGATRDRAGLPLTWAFVRAVRVGRGRSMRH